LLLSGIVFDVTKEETEKQKLLDAKEKLTEKINQDDVTKLYTRAAITVRLVKGIDKAKKEHIPFALLLLKVEKINQYDEAFGPVFVDEILSTTGRIVQSVIQGKGSAGRYRHDLVLVLLENTDEETARAIGERIRQEVEYTAFSQPVEVTISGGLSLYQKTDETISPLVQRTAQRLTQAVEEGGNRIVG